MILKSGILNYLTTNEVGFFEKKVSENVIQKFFIIEGNYYLHVGTYVDYYLDRVVFIVINSDNKHYLFTYKSIY